MTLPRRAVSIVLAGLLAPAHAAPQQPPPAPEHADTTKRPSAPGTPTSPEALPVIEQSALMQTLASFPTARAALGDDASRAGLRAMEELVLTRLKAMGYAPTTQDIPYSMPVRDWPKPDQPPTNNSKTPTIAPTPAPATPTTPQPPDAGDGAHPQVWRNIIVEIPGTQAPAEVLVISAHVDAVVRAPGADDDGSGVAVLLEVARVLKDRPARRTIRFIFFNLEELGLVGSRHYVSQQAALWKEGKEKIVGMVSLDGVGYFSEAPNSQKSPLPPIPGKFEPRTTGDFIAMVTVSGAAEFNKALESGMKTGAPSLQTFRFDVLPVPIPDILRSDHAPFLAQGVPAVMMTDTANFRSPHYHTPTDTIDTIDAPRLTLVARGLAAACVQIANAP